MLDELHIAIAPVLLGSGERLFAGVDMPALGFELTDEYVGTPRAGHYVLARKRG